MKNIPPFTIIYEDDNIIAVNKAAGVLVGGDRWVTGPEESRERLDRLIAGIVPGSKIFVVHRIDRETSGLVVFAKNWESHRELSLAFQRRDAVKRYIAVVHGRPPWRETACDLPLVPNGNKQHQTIIDKYRGKQSLTRFKLVCGAGNYSVLEAWPETGRTHQIRVHAAALGFPVVCDTLYGRSKPVLLSGIKKNWRGDRLDEKPLLARLGLHAESLSLPADSFSGKMSAALSSGNNLISFHAPPPRDIAALVKQIKKIASFGTLE